MTIVEALKIDGGLRLTNFRKWMYWDEFNELWEVREARRSHDDSIVLISTESEEEAVSELFK